MANRWGNNGNSERLFSWAPKSLQMVTAAMKLKRRLPLGRKTMTNLCNILKNKDITLLTKVHLVKAMVLPVVMYGSESWSIKKAEHWRIYAFELWCWRRLLRVPWTARRSSQSLLKEICPECSLEELMVLNCGVGEDSWESLGQQGDQTSQSWRKSVLNIRWKDWCWSCSSNTLATWCEEQTHWKRVQFPSFAKY